MSVEHCGVACGILGCGQFKKTQNSETNPNSKIKNRGVAIENHGVCVCGCGIFRCDHL